MIAIASKPIRKRRQTRARRPRRTGSVHAKPFIYADFSPRVQYGPNLYVGYYAQGLEWDPLGWRGLTIAIHYNEGLKLSDSIKKKVEAIFQACFATCIPKCDKGNFIHKVTIQFKEVPANTNHGNFEAVIGKEKIGKDKKSNPTYYGWYVHHNTNARAVGGQPAKNYAWINVRNIKDQISHPKNYDDAVAGAVAHEVGWHGIGGRGGHPNVAAGFVDDRVPSGEFPPTVFSKKACDEICDKLDINK